MATNPLDAAWSDASQPASTNPLGSAQTAAAAASTGQSSLDAAWSSAVPASASAPAGAAASAPAGAAAPAAAPAAHTANDLVGTLGVAPAATAASPAAAAPTNYQAGVSAVQTASDPQTLMAQQDRLARTVMANLQAAGHDVSWDGTHLTVDGRPYEMAGQSWTAPASSAPGFDNGWNFAAHAGQSTATNAAEPKYQVGAVLQKMDPNDPNWAPVAAALLNQEATAKGLPAQYVANSGTRLSYGDEFVDSTKQAGQFFWGSNSGGAGGGGAAGGLDLSGLFDGGTPSGGSSAVASLQGLTGGTPNYDAMWSLSPTSLYTASQIGNQDMPDWSYESLLADAQQNNPVTTATDQSVNALLANPDSVSQHTIDMLEAQDAEQQQQAAQQEDTALKRFGFQSGITDSPWLASERAATARSRDASILGNRRNIELTAAQTNKSDERAAAQIGSQYQGQRAQQQQAAINTAVEGAMRKATETSNRFSINENLKVEAAKLSMTADQLRQQWVTTTLGDLTKRYGIDLGVKVDTAKLSEQSDEFKADLMYRLQALKQQASQFDASQAQQDAQFGATLGYNYDQLNAHEMDQYFGSLN